MSVLANIISALIPVTIFAFFCLLLSYVFGEGEGGELSPGKHNRPKRAKRTARTAGTAVDARGSREQKST